jgi:hypothetical protein
VLAFACSHSGVVKCVDVVTGKEMSSQHTAGQPANSSSSSSSSSS